MLANRKKMLSALFSICFLFLLASSITQNVNNSTVFAQTDQASSSTTVKIPPPLDGIAPPDHTQAQSLEKTEITILSTGGEQYKFSVEIAQTAKEQAKGMMFRDRVEPNTGMLFLFPDERERNFWMKNTFVPLDLLFIRKDGVIHHIHHNAKPESLDFIKSNGNVAAVLEIAGGQSAKLGINRGNRILYDAFLPKENEQEE